MILASLSRSELSWRSVERKAKHDEQSGGVSAVHTQHKFAKKKGANGMRQGDYERTVLDVLRKRGHRIVLGPETNMPGIKSFDGFLDDIPMEIKAIEGIRLFRKV